MTSLWLTLLVLAAPPHAVRDAVNALQAHQYIRADRLAQAYLQQLPALPNDEDVVTAKLVSAFARLRGGTAKDALSGLDLLEADHIDLGPHGIALRVQALAASDSCAQALHASKSLPQDSLWAMGAWSHVAACMLHHNPTLPVHHPMPEGVQEVTRALLQAANTSRSPQDAAHAWLLAGRLTSAWGDAVGADDMFAGIASRFGSLTDGHRAHADRVALRKSGRLTSPLAVPKLALDVEAMRRILQSRTERCALRQDMIKARARHKALGPNTIQATLNLARLEHIEQHYQAAHTLLHEVLQTNGPATAQERATAHLMLGDLLHVEGQPERAQASWQAAAKASAQSPYGTIALLHGAAARAGQNDAVGARALLQGARARLPLPYAALVVRDDGAATVQAPADAQAESARLGKLLGLAPLQTLPLGAALPTDAPTASGRPRLAAPDLMAIELLIEHHLPEVARRCMRQLPAQDLSPTERLVAAHLYERLGDTFRATLLMAQCDASCRALDPTAQALVYPAPFEADVLAASRKAHVPAALVYAIMREESGFNPGARSPRGATGLMQLMPGTARALARQAHVAAPTHQALLRPRVSIVLGAQLLGQLYRHFHGNVAAVAAAYQAGQPKAQSWFVHAARVGKAEHMTQVIPLTSSRIYVEHIELAYAHYLKRGSAFGARR